MINHHELRDEMFRRVRRLLATRGESAVEEVDSAGNYEWRKEYLVGPLWIMEENYTGEPQYTVYINHSGGLDGPRTDVACAFTEGGKVVRTWEPEFVIVALEVLRRDMLLDDLADTGD